jgi:hypothetical protein
MSLLFLGFLPFVGMSLVLYNRFQKKYVFSKGKYHPQSAPALPQGMAGAIVFDKKTRGRIEDAT